MWKRMLVMLFAVALLFGGIGFLKWKQIRGMKAAMAASRPPPPTVTSTKAKETSWQPKVRAVGSFRAVRGVRVTTEVPGLVDAVAFDSGKDVKQGDVLVRLSSDTDEARLAQMKAEEKLAEKVYERGQELYRSRTISREELDRDLADIELKKARVAEQQALLGKKTIRAPFAGRLGITTVDPGDYLRPGDPIVSLQTLDPIHVDFHVPQSLLPELAVGQEVGVTTDAWPNRTFPGKITSIEPEIDRDTRNVLVEATLDNSDRALRPGMFADVAVEVGKPVDRVTLPKTAISYNPYGDTVYVLRKEGKEEGGGLVAHQVFVRLGPSRGDQVAVEKGVKSGDRVVTSGQLELRDGVRVRVDNSVTPRNDASPEPRDE